MNNSRRGKARHFSTRLLSFLIAWCMVAAFIPTVEAGGLIPVSAGISNASGHPGDSVTVSVYADPGNEVSLLLYKIKVSYDAQVLELNSPNPVTDNAASAQFSADTNAIGSIQVNAGYFGTNYYLEPNQKVFTISFKIKAGAALGDSPVSISTASYSEDETNWSAIPTVTAGKVTITTVPDTVAPTVTSATYSDTLKVSANLQLTFSEAVIAVNGKSIIIKKWADDSVVTTIAVDDQAQISLSGTTVTINPMADLEYGTKYYVLIDAGAFRDAASNAYAGIADKLVWSFTTEAVVSQTATVGIGSAAGEAGQSVEVPVTIVQASTGVASYGVQVNFDAAALEVASITGKSGNYLVSTFNNENGWLKVAWVDAQGGTNAIAAGSTLFIVKFNLKAGASAGDKELTVSNQTDVQYFTVTDTAAVELSKTLTAGKVTINPSSPSNPDNPGNPDNSGNPDNPGDSGGDSSSNDGNGSTGSTSTSSSSGSSASESVRTGVDVLVNGKAENAGTATTTTVNGQTVTVVAVDQSKLEARLAAEGQGTVISIPIHIKSDKVIGELNGQMISRMEQQQAVIEIRTDKATYTLPAKQIDIQSISEQIGRTVSLQDIKVQIEMAAPSADMLRVVASSASAGMFEIVVPPLEFTVKAVYGDLTIDITQFQAYVERTIAIPEGIDPNKITTGVVIDPDGTVRHVPTRVVNRDGRYYAVVNSLTNSIYSIVWHPLEFKDVVGHWAKDAVNNMGSRMVVNGSGNDIFNPDQDTTRAEFAAIMVRGLGLKLEKGPSSFVDVHESDWYSSAVQTAYAYKLLSGFEDGRFRPMDKITREQAMIIIARAMTVSGLKAKLPASAVEQQFHAFADGADIAEWAKNDIADCLKAGIVSGRSASELAPKAYITRAEVAHIVQKLLQKSELI
ncbi:S-layer homology domain-containing protein [Paenibacillus sp. FSL H8-0034]|uniref:S-layer homology domain-containing protein n=1 Tax=Paenibacillus sp. FSL H8-0034 TaxID=2954671 RepID=UPI0030FCE13E